MKGLFRGFCRDENSEGTIVLNGEEIKGYWLVGSLVHTIYETYDGKLEDSYRIREEVIGLDDENFPTYQSGCDEEVIPETICEAVRGALDMNRKQIYEGDIIRNEIDGETYEIYYNEKKNGLYARGEKDDGRKFDLPYIRAYFDKVIGTIFDKEKNDGNDC